MAPPDEFVPARTPGHRVDGRPPTSVSAPPAPLRLSLPPHALEHIGVVIAPKVSACRSPADSRSDERVALGVAAVPMATMKKATIRPEQSRHK